MVAHVRDLSDSTPVADAARRVLSLRLETVRDRIGDALGEPQRGGQRIHALRVATRRAAAAVDLFGPCLPRKAGKHLRGRLRMIRRAAGEARDWDVVLGDIAQRLEGDPQSDHPAHDMLTGFILAHRIPAENRLLLACRDYPFGFDRLLAGSLAAIRHRGPVPVTLGGHAGPAVMRMVSAFDETCQRGDGGTWEHLHEVRIAAKRLRYVLELVPTCIDPRLGGHLAKVLGSLQETLGVVNDSYNQSKLLRSVLEGIDRCLPATADRYRGLIGRRVEEHQATMEAGRADFSRWLDAWRISIPAFKTVFAVNALGGQQTAVVSRALTTAVELSRQPDPARRAG